MKLVVYWSLTSHTIVSQIAFQDAQWKLSYHFLTWEYRVFRATFWVISDTCKNILPFLRINGKMTTERPVTDQWKSCTIHSVTESSITTWLCIVDSRYVSLIHNKRSVIPHRTLCFLHFDSELMITITNVQNLRFECCKF